MRTKYQPRGQIMNLNNAPSLDQLKAKFAVAGDYEGDRTLG